MKQRGAKALTSIYRSKVYGIGHLPTMPPFKFIEYYCGFSLISFIVYKNGQHTVCIILFSENTKSYHTLGQVFVQFMIV